MGVFPEIAAALKGIGWAFFPAVLIPMVYLIWPKFHGPASALIQTIDSLNYGLGEIAKWGLPLLVLSTAFSVFALSIFGLSWTKLFESAEYFHASVIMLGAAATLLAGQHVRVDVFHSRMNERQKALVDLCGFYAALLPVCLIILWKSQSFTNFAWMIFEGSNEADGIQGRYLLKTLIPVFAVTMIAQGLSIALRAAMVLSGQTRPTRPGQTSPLFGKVDGHKVDAI